ncbi:MAG TPA: SCP2 sterol-binding domain-containing protein [Stellaceae bacterium]|nr:SCP2 sterol-binding domain-containing protein [Stellaceae bacterium]
MSLESATAAIRAKAALAPKLGYRVTFDLSSDGIIYWDGTQVPAAISNEAGEADTTLTLSLEDLQKLIEGNLNPTLAYMTGKLKVAGSMGVALKISQLLED